MRKSGEFCNNARWDVIVIGYGFAGAMAAIHAHDAGARVLLIDKNPDPGGISVCSAGGLRISDDAEKALAYLVRTNAGTTPEPVMKALAAGMAGLAEAMAPLCEAAGARLGLKSSPANYPLPGYESFGFAYVDDVQGFDAAAAYPAVRGSPAGARLFEVVRRNVALRQGIEVRLAAAAERLAIAGGRVTGVIIDGKASIARAVVLACGGFEGDAAMQSQFWPMQPVLSAASRFNTGDGIRMGQMAGAALWHMWHYHGSYGFRHPDAAYPFGIRVKRLPDWNPADGLREDVKMSWILVDQDGRRFMNEYEPYMQDTGHRPFELYDPARQRHPRVPALMLLDARGRALYPLASPTWHDREVAERYVGQSSRAFDDAVLFESPSIQAIAGQFGIDQGRLQQTVARWNADCARALDDQFGRPPGSMMPITEPPFSAAPIWPIVSNTQGGLVHDEGQRALDAFGSAIPGLFVAGELGSVFGHLYMSGGNIAECFVGGRIAGIAAAAIQPTSLTENAV
jgi:succinate dehydrogenase/fumarate reductase flavoprotein subunit